MEEKKNSCDSCEYFSRHYIKYNGEYVPIEIGTCMCGELSGDERRNYIFAEGCAFYKHKEKNV